MIVRRAELGDMNWLVCRFEKASKFYPTQASLFNWKHVEVRLSEMMVNHLMLVAERDGELIGYIGGYFAPHIFNPELSTLIQVLWWVDEEHRGGRAAYLLMKEFDKAGSRCDFTWMSVHKDTNIKDSSMERMGYEPLEKWYLKERA